MSCQINANLIHQMSDVIEIKLDREPPNYRPGELIEGAVRWAVSSEVNKVELRLFLHTSGRGTQDVEVTHRTSWYTSGRGSERFSFIAPPHPHSFSGALISLQWSIEAVALPGEYSVRHDLVVSPSGEELMIKPLENPRSEPKITSWLRPITNR